MPRPDKARRPAAGKKLTERQLNLLGARLVKELGFTAAAKEIRQGKTNAASTLRALSRTRLLDARRRAIAKTGADALEREGLKSTGGRI